MSASDDDDGPSLEENEWKNDDFLSFQAESVAPAVTRETADPRKPLQSGDYYAGTDLPPWMTSVHKPACHRLVALHNEIVQFVQLMEPTAAEITQRVSLVQRVRALIEKALDGKATVDVFGSQATGLFLPTSDIDLVVMIPAENDNVKLASSADAEHNNAMPVLSPLQTVAQALRQEWLSELSYLEVIEQTRVPLVKFTHAPSQTSVDICFQQETGPRAAALMKTYLQALPPLRPLTICLKYFLGSRELHQPYTGGVGSYMLQLMIVSMLQHRARDAINFRRPCVECLGSLLLEFLELYGMEFNYVTTAISVRHDGFYFPKGASSKKEVFWQAQRPFSCALENPLDTTMDVGQGSFRIQLVQRAFAVAYKTILAHVAEPVVPAKSILATILDPTEEMRARQRKKSYVETPVAKRSADGADYTRRENKSRRRSR